MRYTFSNNYLTTLSADLLSTYTLLYLVMYYTESTYKLSLKDVLWEIKVNQE